MHRYFGALVDPAAADRKVARVAPAPRSPVFGFAHVDALTQSGFRVDEVFDSNVTAGVMQKLADYSSVYMRTHSGVLPGGDAIVVTGESDSGPYASLYKDHSLMQAFVAGDPTGTLYNAITATIVTKHMGTFPDSSIMFLNGCSLLRAPTFWTALQKQNVATMISWDHEVYSTVSEPAGEFILTDLAKGDSVETDIAAAYTAGLGTSVVGDEVAKLGFLGDGSETLPRALAGATPTLTPEPTATATSTPTPLPTPTRRIKCKRGQYLIHGKCRPKHPHCKRPRCKKRL